MNNLYKITFAVLPAVVGLPLTAEAAPTEAEKKEIDAAKQRDDALLPVAKERITRVLMDAGVISTERGQAIIDAPVENSGRSNIRVRYEEELKFLTSAAHLVSLRQENSKKKDPDTAAALEYVEEVAKAIGTADLLLRLDSDGSNISIMTVDAWENCVRVSMLNLMFNKNIDYDTAVRKYDVAGILRYALWDEQKKVFRFNGKLFAADYDLDSPEEEEGSPAPTADTPITSPSAAGAEPTGQSTPLRVYNPPKMTEEELEKANSHGIDEIMKEWKKQGILKF